MTQPVEDRLAALERRVESIERATQRSRTPMRDTIDDLKRRIDRLDPPPAEPPPPPPAGGISQTGK